MKRLVASAAMAALTLTGLGALTLPAGAESADASVAKVTKWAPCDSNLTGIAQQNGVTVECADLQIPLDYAHPRGKKISVALSRIKHTGPAKAYQGILLTNPGGPGGTGRDFAIYVAGGLPKNLQGAYDTIGFDPRGVGGSTPSLHCVNDYFHAPLPDYVPGSKAAEVAWEKKSADYAAACGKKYGSLLDHLKTTDAVRDMDSIRSALHQQKINYYGASYGTYLGAVYATMFPTHVRRMVLDSNIDPRGVWYQANISQDYAFNRNEENFFHWIAQYDSVYHLGATRKAVHDFYYGTRANLVKHPAGGKVGGAELDDTVTVAGYTTGVWKQLASALAAYKKGDTKPLLDAFQNYDGNGGVIDDNGFAMYAAVECTDAAWPRNWATWDTDTRRVAKQAPAIAWSNTWFNAPCAYWPAKAGKPVDIKANKGLPPVLLFQATLDAATPFPGGPQMHKQLAGSRLVIEDGGRTHGVVQRGNACLDDKFNAYLATGALPADLSTCKALPDPNPTTPTTKSQTIPDDPIRVHF